MTAIFPLLWLFGVYVFLMVLAAPLLAVYLAYQFTPSPMLLFLGVPAALLVAPLLLAAFLGVLYTFFPKPEIGSFRMFSDRGAVLWAINNAPAILYLRWFQKTLFLNDPIRYFVLKALRCDVKATSWLTGNTELSDLRCLHFGEGVLVGEHAHLGASYQGSKGQLVVGEIWIGNKVLIGAYSKVGADVRIGDGTIVQYGAEIAPHCTIGEGCRIETQAVLFENCKIGKGARIGRRAVLPKNSVVPEGGVVPPFTVWKGPA